MELLQSVKYLQKMGFTLYASMGTGDFYTEHNVEVSSISVTTINTHVYVYIYTVIICEF